MKGRTNIKARLGIATAVLVGGGAIGVAAVATGSHSGTTTAQSSAFGYTLQFRHTMSEGAALSTALNQWSWSHQRAMTTLAQMQSMRNFSQVMAGSRHHRTMYAAQRGTVLFVDKNLMLVKSSNGAEHLWWLNTNTGFANVSSNATGMVAMTGNNNAGFQAMVNNNMAPAEAAVAGSVSAANAAAAPVTKPVTFTIQTGTETVTITITPSSATVSTPPTTPPTTPPATPTGMASATPSMTPTMAPTGMASATPSISPSSVSTTQPAITNVNGVATGDMVFVAGERVNGRLIAKLVFYTPTTTTTTPTPPASASVSTSTAPTTGTTPTTSVAPTGTAPSFSGVGS